ncbi:TetR/AcrR family transcriptional regulator [Corallococcus praedator]|uniref:TetR/AcrR family transcriptional regulator n=1 Tax=Corallococcus praedator TaxID=2316724 RepID=A0ABX9QIP5_9BACT|nr:MULTISPECIES: TetR/AcrR family transcriptional regulator [Corallococcus]RKH05899.1 TetR/AcrR family transcriptional regulator [Corallococcus sp. CA047B]RKH28794.1 TetR/AcrR family transcriptional regulator [Corallococcus sp. CA031C]RKI07829.1 TetR/AcrR family transcriptional regulator [Corallococcus praedator]
MATRSKRTVKEAPKELGDKPRYHHGDLRQALVDAAVALISEEGFGALTLREVARRAGVTHAAPYRHFTDKEALLGAVALEGFRAMAREMRERMDRAPEGPLEQLSAAGVAYVLFAVRHPPHFRVMFGPHFQRPLKPRSPEGEPDAFALLVGCIAAGQSAGLLRQGEPRALTLTAWSLVHGLASLFVDRQLDEAVQGLEAAEALAVVQTRLLISGLAHPGAGGNSDGR